MTIAAMAIASCSRRPADGEYTLHIFSTNDVHGRYFDSLYVGNQTRESLLAVSAEMNALRDSIGKENVILIDAGDFLQGDNASYFFNYIDTESKHLHARMAEYMGYDALTVGNHDIETGHAVYDRYAKSVKVPFLAANAIRDDNGKPYFQPYTIIKRHGLKIAIMGYTNANIKGWLSPTIWEGMTFADLCQQIQSDVDNLRESQHPDLVIVTTHTGTGPGDGSVLESQGRDLLNSLQGVDFLLCSHDHRAHIEGKDEVNGGDRITLINAGSHCRTLGHGCVTMTVSEGGRKVVKSSQSGELIKIDKTVTDTVMRDMFRPEYERVKEFTIKEIGKLDMTLRTTDAYMGMCDYMNLIHTVSLGCTPAQLSMAAPLTFNGEVKAGTVIYNDLFTIYPFENQLFVVKMTGRQIKDYLEYSYDNWINTIASADDHILKVRAGEDPRTGQQRWSFVERSYNFDSMAGASYTVDVTKPKGERITIRTLADGSAFDLEATYNVAMTSYRASGGGHIMSEGAGIDTDRIDELVVERYPEIRELIYDYFKKHTLAEGAFSPVTSEELSNASVIGSWSFIPEEIVAPALTRDMLLLFPENK